MLNTARGERIYCELKYDDFVTVARPIDFVIQMENFHRLEDVKIVAISDMYYSFG